MSGGVFQRIRLCDGAHGPLCRQGGDDDAGSTPPDRGPRHTGCRVPVYRFLHDILLRQFWQLLFHQLEVLLTRTYIDILFGQDSHEAFEGRLQHGLSRPEKIHKLLGMFISACRPKSLATSSCEDDTEIVFLSYIHGNVISLNNCVRR